MNACLERLLKAEGGASEQTAKGVEQHQVSGELWKLEVEGRMSWKETRGKWLPLFPHSHLTSICCQLFSSPSAALTRVRWNLKAVFLSIPLITKDVEYLKRYFLAISGSFLRNSLFRFIVHFLHGSFAFFDFLKLLFFQLKCCNISFPLSPCPSNCPMSPHSHSYSSPLLLSHTHRNMCTHIHKYNLLSLFSVDNIYKIFRGFNPGED